MEATSAAVDTGMTKAEVELSRKGSGPGDEARLTTDRAALPHSAPDEHSPIVSARLRYGMRYGFAAWQQHGSGMPWRSPPLSHRACFGGATHRDVLGPCALLCPVMEAGMIHRITTRHIV